MRVLYITTKSEAGGAQTHIFQLSRYMKEKGFEVAVMSGSRNLPSFLTSSEQKNKEANLHNPIRSKEWLRDEIEKLGITFYPNKYFSNIPNPFTIFKAIREIKKVIKDFNPDLVCCHSTAAGFLGRITIKNKIPTIFTAHGWALTKGTPFLRKTIAILIEKIAGKFCSKIICVSNFDKSLVLKYKIVPINKIEVVHNGVDLQNIENHQNSKLSIVFVGRLAKPKDPLLLLKAFNDLSPELKDKASISIIGDGPKLKQLKEFIKETKLEGINLLGSMPRTKVLETLKKSDIFVLISDWEGFPYTIIEAMSCGLPVIASDVGGIREAIDNECGILVKRGDQQEIKQALERLLKNPSLIREMGKNAKERLEKEFSLDKMLKETEQVYKKVIFL